MALQQVYFIWVLLTSKLNVTQQNQDHASISLKVDKYDQQILDYEKYVEEWKHLTQNTPEKYLFSFLIMLYQVQLRLNPCTEYVSR